MGHLVEMTGRNEDGDRGAPSEHECEAYVIELPSVNAGRKVGHFHWFRGRPLRELSRGFLRAGLGLVVGGLPVSQAIGVSFPEEDLRMGYQSINHGRGKDGISVDVHWMGKNTVDVSLEP